MTADRPQDAAIDRLRKACRCLYLELPESIADDVKQRAEAVISRFSLLEAENARLRKAFAKYASHLFDCPQHAYSNRQHLACECGLEELFLVVSPPSGSPPNE